MEAPPKTIDELPPAPAEVFGLHLHVGYWRERRDQKERRRRVLIGYLKKYGGLSTETIAQLFGMSMTAAYRDLYRMALDGRITHSRKAPYVWRAA